MSVSGSKPKRSPAVSGGSNFNTDAYYMLMGFISGGYFVEAKAIVQNNPQFLENRLRFRQGVDGKTTILPLLETCITTQNLPGLLWCIEQGAKFFNAPGPILQVEEGGLTAYQWQSSTLEQAMGAGVPYVKALVDAFSVRVLELAVDTIKGEQPLGRAIRLAKVDMATYILSMRPDLLGRPVDGLRLRTFKSHLFYCRHLLRESMRDKNTNDPNKPCRLAQIEDAMLAILSHEQARKALVEIGSKTGPSSMPGVKVRP